MGFLPNPLPSLVCSQWACAICSVTFEGEAETQHLARPCHSREECSDCLWLTLALVSAGSGFVRRSQVLAGNVQESARPPGH